jgi:A118 family predicted phage portal protein
VIIPADSVWPPAALAPITDPINTWATWYEGDPEKLAALYGGYSQQQRYRPSQHANGMQGRISRWWWGQPVPTGQTRAKSHVPVARDIARASASLLFGEELQLDTGKVDQARLREVLDGNRWQSLLPEAAEYCAALGGVYLKIGWDQGIAQYPLISIAQADAAIPTFRWGRLAGVTFWQVVRREGASVWRHLETHKPGRIDHALYQGTATHLGRLVPLTESDQTADIPVDSQAGVPTGTSLLTAVYVPNVKPAPGWRNDPLGRNLGCSDFAGLEPRFDELDEAWGNWRREMRLNRTRIIAASALLDSMGPGKGASFDADREVFVPVQAVADAPGLPITVMQSKFTVEDHAKTVEAIARDIYSEAGYSPSTFGLTDDVGITATEVAARERKTMTTRETKSRYWTAGLEDFLESVTAVDRFVFSKGEQVRPKVMFPAAVSPTTDEVAKSVQLLNLAQAASVDTRVRMIHPDWTDEQVGAEVQRIMVEQSMTTPSINLDPELGGGLQ